MPKGVCRYTFAILHPQVKSAVSAACSPGSPADAADGSVRRLSNFLPVSSSISGTKLPQSEMIHAMSRCPRLGLMPSPGRQLQLQPLRWTQPDGGGRCQRHSCSSARRSPLQAYFSACVRFEDRLFFSHRSAGSGSSSQQHRRSVWHGMPAPPTGHMAPLNSARAAAAASAAAAAAGPMTSRLSHSCATVFVPRPREYGRPATNRAAATARAGGDSSVVSAPDQHESGTESDFGSDDDFAELDGAGAPPQCIELRGALVRI